MSIRRGKERANPVNIPDLSTGAPQRKFVRKKLSPRRSTPERPGDSLQPFIDCFEDELLIVGADFRVKKANAAVRRRLGIAPGDIIGLPCYRVNHGAEEPCHPPWRECPLNRVFETGQPMRVIHAQRESTQPEEAGERWVEMFLSPIRDGSGKVTEVIELVRDVSENRKLKKELLRANRELLAVNSIARALNQSLDLQATLQAAAKGMLEALEAQLSWIQLADDVSKLPTAWASEQPSVTSDELMEAISNMCSGKEITTSATYSIMPGCDSGNQSQSLWQFAVTPLKSKNIVLGRAGVATAKRPVDQQRIQLLDAIGHQIAVAIERCRLYEEVQAARNTLGKLLHRVITTQEEERKRIARELHDETGQALFALRLSLEDLALTPVAGKDEIKSRLDQSLTLCQQADEDVDKLIFDLRPALLDDLGLVPAIEFCNQTRLKATDTRLSLSVSGKETRLSSEKEVALFRIIQESINNIVKHAHAKNANMHLKFTKKHLVVTIKDDGCGFETSQVISSQNPKSGLGLLGMRERISLVGGSLKIVSQPGGGTKIVAVVPLDKEADK